MFIRTAFLPFFKPLKETFTTLTDNPLRSWALRYVRIGVETNLSKCVVEYVNSHS